MGNHRPGRGRTTFHVFNEAHTISTTFGGNTPIDIQTATRRPKQIRMSRGATRLLHWEIFELGFRTNIWKAGKSETTFKVK